MTLTSTTNTRMAAVGVIGYGVAAAQESSAAAILSSVRSGRAFEQKHRRSTDKQLVEAAGIREIEARKMDRISLLTLAAVRRALEGISLSSDELRQCGMYVGNAVAGWSFAEPQLETMYRRGPLAVSPYLATAWFPAAPQGHTSISLGFQGIAKTITTDRSAGAQAILLASERIRHSDPRPYFAGGVEAPVTKFVESAYRGCQWQADCLCEAASFLVLAPVMDHTGSIEIGPAITRRATDASVEAMVAIAARDLADAPPLVAMIIDAQPEAPALERFEYLLDQSFGKHVERLWPTPSTGDSLAASSSLAVILGCEVIQQKERPASVIAFSIGHQCTTSIQLRRRSK